MSLAKSAEERRIIALQRGSEAALGEIIETYTAYVGSIVWSIVQPGMDQSDAAEIVSEVFYTLWQNREKVRPGALRGYLGTIARSRAINALRRVRPEEPLEEDLLPLTVPGPEDETLRREEYAALRRAVESLGEPDRRIFLLHYYSYQSASQISKRLGLNLNTVHTKLRRGRERLKAELEKGGYCRG